MRGLINRHEGLANHWEAAMTANGPAKSELCFRAVHGMLFWVMAFKPRSTIAGKHFGH